MTPIPRSRIAAIGLVAVLSACTAQRTTLWPYTDDPELDALLAKRAATACACLRAGTNLPPHRFTTDGCSMGVDGDRVGCCLAHDIEYWCGGSADDRRAADARFASCIEALERSSAIADAVHGLVRVGGAPRSPLPWRWGYGWSEIRDYDASSNPGDADTCLRGQ